VGGRVATYSMTIDWRGAFADEQIPVERGELVFSNCGSLGLVLI
jgi:hypothetical protein